MKFFGYVRQRDFVSEERLRYFLDVVDRSGVEHCVNVEAAKMVYEITGIKLPSFTQPTMEDVEEGSIMISVGGDGTFLEAVQNMKGLPMPIIGVNIGRLGFLAGISPENFEEALNEIKRSNYSIQKRSMLSIEGDFGTEVEFPCALNEFTIHRHNANMVEIPVYADGYQVAIGRGDGAIVATPTGSTAYSLSAGGPIVSPECSCFVLTALAPHNFTIRPLVLPDTTKLDMKVFSRGSDVSVSIDNRSYIVPDGAEFTVCKSNFSTFLMQLQNISFYDTLRNKMMWGLDTRNGVE